MKGTEPHPLEPRKSATLMKILVLLATLLPLSAHLVAQSGPGGVGNSGTNVLWLDASYGVTAPTAGVSSWADRSGAGNTVVQSTPALQPVYVPNSINGYPTVTFDNDQTNPDHLSRADNATLEGMSGLTAFCVYQLASGTNAVAPRGFLSKRNGPDNQEAYAWFLYNGGGSGTTIQQYLDIDGTGNRVNSSTSYTTGTTYINSFVYDGSLPSNSSDQVLYDGNTAVGNASETSTSIPNYSSNLYIGSLRGHTGSGGNTTRFNGNISELILFNYALGSAQRIIVNNYLAAKYGTTLATRDLYVQDNSGNGNYDHDVAGIGSISTTDQQTDSRGTGLVQISGATNLDAGEFCFWGHNNGTLTLGTTSDYPAGLYGRWDRVWRTSEVTTAGAATNVGAVDMTFHLSGLQVGNATADLRLLVDANNNGVFADDTPISGAIALGGDRFRFAGVTALTDGMRFTLGTMAATTLPIELLFFEAHEQGRTAELEWATASEQHNHHFAVERSHDMQYWSEVGQLPGAGTSAVAHHYRFVDALPFPGTSYYRLRQVDLDQTSTLSVVRAVRFGPTDGAPFPNPTNGTFSIALPATTSTLQLFDALGRPLLADVRRTELLATVQLTDLPPGNYLLVIETDGAHTVHHVHLQH